MGAECPSGAVQLGPVTVSVIALLEELRQTGADGAVTALLAVLLPVAL